MSEEDGSRENRRKLMAAALNGRPTRRTHAEAAARCAGDPICFLCLGPSDVFYDYSGEDLKVGWLCEQCCRQCGGVW